MARGLLQRDQGPAGAVALQTTVSTCHRACVTDPRLSRVDHVGSLLRSRELLDARRGRDRGELDSAAFKAERLAVEGAIDLLLLVCEPREFGLAFVVVGFSGTCEFLSE